MADKPRASDKESWDKNVIVRPGKCLSSESKVMLPSNFEKHSMIEKTTCHARDRLFLPPEQGNR